MNSMILPHNQLTMSSLVMAELTEKRHANVVRTIETLMSNGVIGGYSQIEYTHPQNGQIYYKYEINKRDSYVVVAQLSPEFTARLVDRWQELESKQYQPEKLGRKELALMVIAQEEEIERLGEQKALADAEVSRLQGVCNTITAQFTTGMTPAQFCRELNGVNINKVQKSLVERGMLLESVRGYKSSSYYRDNWFAERTEEHNGHIFHSVILTIKGAKELYKLYLSDKLPMKKTWNGKHTHALFESEAA